MPALFSHRLIFVTGKGGVGKSTVATSLGLLAARRGLRTIVAELASQDRVQQAFDHHGDSYSEVEVAPGLHAISIDPQHAMEEYLRVKTGAVGQVLAHSRLFAIFAMATPGMRELLSIGKIWELAQLNRRTDGGVPYDLVIVDAPATGHGVGFLRTPRTFADIARVGPIAHQGKQIAATIADRSFTAIVAVATAEEMPVNETLVMRDAIEREGLRLDAVILNAVYPERFTEPEIGRLRQRLGSETSAAAQAALRAALSEGSRAQIQREQRARLQSDLGMEPIVLPYLFSDGIGPQQLQQLADALEGATELTSLSENATGSVRG